ncbi:MAG TPA: HAD family phosphatase [Acidimicrobiia bacterium]|jgi:HAD superfamily hydrolase (TIGR01509 family)
MSSSSALIGAVVFDLDGVLVDSEQLWDRARRDLVAAHGGVWRDGATTAMQGMSSPEWAAYLHDTLGVDLAAAEIVDRVVDDLLDRYRSDLPLLPGAVAAVRRIGRRWPLVLASSSNRVVIDTVLDVAGLDDAFAATVSSEEVPRGKPEPDVYEEAARRIDVPPRRCVAVEDSTSGIRAAAAAGLGVIAVPNRSYPPLQDALDDAALVLHHLDELTVEAVERAGGRSRSSRR